LFAVGLALGLASCDVYDESLVTGGAGGPLRHAPPRPTTPDGPDVEPLTVALRDPVINQGDLWREIGLDLDGFATASMDSETECLPGRSNTVPIDGEEGIDNIFGAAFVKVVTGFIPELQAEAVAAQHAGNGTLIIRMSKWNGTPNDPLVQVIISQAVDGTPADPSLVEWNDDFELVMKADGSPAPPPEWEGNDHWWVRDDTFVGGDETQPRISDDAAYVADNKVVLRLPDGVDIFFFIADKVVKVNLTGAMSVGTMNADHSELTDTIVAGRWGKNDLLDTADYINICEGPIKTTLTNTIDFISDVRSQVGTGNTGARCDAISLGMRFGKGVLGSWEGLVPAPPVRNPCEGVGADGGV
jgi:hypothetical protein